MSQRRILFVNHASCLSGAELVLLDVAAAFQGASAFLFEDGPLRPALQKRGVTTVLPPGGASFAAIKRDGSLLRALPHVGRLARMGMRLAAAARQHDVVYANSQKAFALAAPACAVARRPLVWHLHDILSPDHFGRAQRALTIAWANRWAARVIAPSRAVADAFTTAGGRAGLLHIVPNGLDDQTGDRPVPLRDSLGLQSPFVFGVFSRLAPWKGQDVALRALALLPEAGCIIAGDALFGEDDYKNSLLALADTLGVSDRVRFLGQRSDVPALMRTVDAVVHPSTEPEPFGRTLVEAMLARRPVIAAQAGAVPEILDEGRAGLLFPPGDSAALAAALRRVQAGTGTALLDVAEMRARTLYNAGRMQDSIRTIIAGIGAGTP